MEQTALLTLIFGWAFLFVLWGGHLWDPSYCVVTVSDRSHEQVKHYIETQKTR